MSEKGYFPIVIRWGSDYFLVHEPERLPMGVPFTVVAVRVQDAPKQHENLNRTERPL